MIGIIIPPGQIKKLAQKTAEHVAINGSQFEKMILQRQQHKIQFAFLKRDSPYRAYYDHMVAEISRKLLQESKQARILQQQKIQNDGKGLQDVSIKVQEVQKKNDEQAQFIQKIFQDVKQPDPDRFTVEEPQKITQAQIAIIQHTAMYVAKNGKNFLVALSERQKNNPQFQFLKSSSANNEYFTRIYQAYQNILNFGDQDIKILNQISNSKEKIFKKCEDTYQYYQMKQNTTKGKGKKQENKKQSNIDWNDFQLVQTIVFESVGRKKPQKNQGTFIKGLNSDNQYINRTMEEKIISQPKKRELLQQCHVCRQNILASEMTKHLKSCLGDKRGKPIISNQNSGQNQQVDIRKNLQNLSKRRPDIFGSDGTRIKRQQIQQKQQKVIWDGQAPNITRTTGSIAMLNFQQKKMKQKQQSKQK